MKSLGVWRTISIIFVTLLIVAAIYSRTLYQWQLPKVKIAMAKTTQSSCSIPIEAVQKDDKGKEFLLLVKEQKRAWGKEYICVQQYVTIAEYTDTYVLLKEVKELKYPVITGSDKHITHGTVVRIYP